MHIRTKNYNSIKMKFNGVSIIESSLQKELSEDFCEKILKHIFVETSDMKINPDFKTLMYNKECDLLSYLQNLKGWENVFDFDIHVLKIKEFSPCGEQYDYLKKFRNVNPDRYNVMYFYIKTQNKLENFYIAIYGKKIFFNKKIESNSKKSGDELTHF
jgi:hypothetical protein